ncbi:MAG: HD domain-containing protein [Campylobacterota bacterium]
MFSQEVYLKALKYAAKAHGEQKTPKGLPYLTHVVSVAMEVINACEKTNLDEDKSNLAISCALLHDTIEDTDVTYDDLYTDFSPNIANGVEALSKNPSLPTKKEQMQDSIEKLMNEPYEVQMVKLADRVSNLAKPPKDWSNEKIVAYYNESKFILSCLKNSNIHLSIRLEEKIQSYKNYIK